MPRHTTPLDQLEVTSPCSADWDSMTGNNRVRFCSHCQLSVSNLSEMTVAEGMELVLRSKGRLCVRFERGPGGTTRTAAPAPTQFHQIKRRASRIAAGAFGAALSLAGSISAQTRAAPGQSTAASVESRTREPSERQPGGASGAAALAGVVTDPNGAVVPGATVTLINTETGHELSTLSNKEGAYRFEALSAGIYSLKINASGFAQSITENLSVQSGAEQRADKQIDVNVEVNVMTMGIMSVAYEPANPLVKAVYENDLAAVKELIAGGADLNSVDEAVGNTALVEAVSGNKREIVEALLRAGADANGRNKWEQTPLMKLFDETSASLVRDLIAAGAKVNLKDEAGNTALMLAAGWSTREVVQALLDAGAKVNAKNKEGRTALMQAVDQGNVENARALINAGAKIDKKDGASALRHARENGQKEVADLLVAYGAFDEGEAEEEASQRAGAAAGTKPKP